MISGKLINSKFRLVVSFYYENQNALSEERCRTPTLNDPKVHGEFIQAERLKLLESRNDGLSGIQEYLSKTLEPSKLQFVILFLNPTEREENLNMHFISWNNYVQVETLGAGQQLQPFRESITSYFNIIDLDQYFPRVI